MKFSAEIEKLFEQDLTKEFAIDSRHISAEVIADSVNVSSNQRLTTLRIRCPRIILPEFNTHRCLVGETKLEFDEPATLNDDGTHKIGLSRVTVYTIEDFHDKWHNGAKDGKIGSVKEFDVTNVNDETIYTCKELTNLTKLSISSIRSACRNGEMSYEVSADGSSFLIKGSAFKAWRVYKHNKTRRFPYQDRLKTMNLRCYDPSTNSLKTTHVTDVWYTGERYTKILRTKTGHVIQGTYDHPVLTNHGWKELQDIIVGTDKVCVLSNKNCSGETKKYDRCINGQYVSQWARKVKPEVFNRQDGLCADCGTPLSDAWDLHHVDDVYNNPDKAFDIDNVVGLCKECHKERHRISAWPHEKSPLKPQFVDVDYIIEGGIRKVYDISVEDDNHNFFANRICVHNCYSRNASSSRAIPAAKMRLSVTTAMFEPVYWGANQSGMAAYNQLTGWRKSAARFVWRLAGHTNLIFHKLEQMIGLHKQICNRLIENWMSVSIVVTSSEWENFLRLRYSKSAQPEAIALAKAIHDAIVSSEPQMLDTEHVHLPFIDQQELETLGIEKCIKISVARCCRTSYDNNLGKKSQPEEDVKLYHRLLTDMHFSPFEHIAFVPKIGRISKDKQYDLQRNFRGWYQLRAFVDNPTNGKYLVNNYNINLQ